MRVALVDPSLFTLPYDTTLARGLENAGCDVTLYGRRQRASDGDPVSIDLVRHFYALSESSRISWLPKVFRLPLKAIDHAVSMLRLLRTLRRLRPGIIHFQWLPLPLLDGMMLGRFRQIAPLVLTVHDTDPFNGDPTAALQRFGIRRTLHGVDRLIVHSRQGFARIVAQDIPPQRIALIPHGRLYSCVSAAADTMQGPITLLLFGKLKRYKGADLLIDAFAALPQSLRSQSKIRIVGKPYMDLAPLYAQARALGVAGRVSIEPGFVPDAEIDSLFSSGSIAVFPYREIEASAVLFQAIANGRPIVASRLGAFDDLLRDGVHGRLVPPCDVPALTRALAELIEHRATAAACAAGVRRLQETIPQWDDVARMTLGVYNDAKGLPANDGLDAKRVAECMA
jgi:glycosyltransferase involved in cell wall biosynthesis